MSTPSDVRRFYTSDGDFFVCVKNRRAYKPHSADVAEKTIVTAILRQDYI